VRIAGRGKDRETGAGSAGNPAGSGRREEDSDPLARERERILAVYARRDALTGDLYAPWRAEELFMRTGRRRIAADLFARAGVFPKAGDACLEVGFGSLGWLAELVSWGLQESDLHGIELDASRAQMAHNALPSADLRVGDAAQMPWQDGKFRLVVASTVFTSILDGRVRQRLAGEITRVLAPGGALLWYDFAVNNPRNPNVRKVSRTELRALFPELAGTIRSVTLAPPLARIVAPRSWVLATLLEALPPLRTHLLAVLVKKP
jgi:SAM-dependent methyltransferase